MTALLLRAHDLGIDARKALTNPQIAAVAAWRQRDESLGLATARADSVRHAKRIVELDKDLKANRDQVTTLVTENVPVLLEMTGVGAVTAAVGMTVWSHPGDPFRSCASPDRGNVPNPRFASGHDEASAEPWR